MGIRPRGNGLQIDVQVTINGDKKRYRETVHTSMEDAKAREAQIKADLMVGREPSPYRKPGDASKPVSGTTLKEAMDWVYDRFYFKQAQARTVMSDIKTCLDFFGEDRDITSITNHDADEFLLWLEGQHYAPTTVNKKICRMSKMFREYHRKGIVKVPPSFRYATVSKDEGVRDRIISDTEFKTLEQLFRFHYDGSHRRGDSLSGNDMADLLITLRHTGARPETLRHVDTSRDLRGDRLFLRKTKTDVSRTLPLTTKAQEAIEALTERHGPNCFEWASKDRITKAWDWARTSMDLEHEKGDFIMYALRHTCATVLYETTRDLVLVKNWLGHKSIDMTLRYAKNSGASLEAARDALEAS